MSQKGSTREKEAPGGILVRAVALCPPRASHTPAVNILHHVLHVRRRFFYRKHVGLALNIICRCYHNWRQEEVADLDPETRAIGEIAAVVTALEEDQRSRASTCSRVTRIPAVIRRRSRPPGTRRCGGPRCRTSASTISGRRTPPGSVPAAWRTSG